MLINPSRCASLAPGDKDLFSLWLQGMAIEAFKVWDGSSRSRVTSSIQSNDNYYQVVFDIEFKLDEWDIRIRQCKKISSNEWANNVIDLTTIQ